MDYKKLQNGSDIRGVAIDGVEGQPVNLTEAASRDIGRGFALWLLKKTGKLGVLPISISGGMFHNVGQLIVAAFVVENYNIFYYMPILLVAGIVTGLLIGVAAQEMILRIGNRFK